MDEKYIYFNHSISTTNHLIAHIHWLNKTSKTISEPDILRGINISITIMLCSYIEAILNDLLTDVIEIRIKETTDTSYHRVLNDLKIKLVKASWNQYLNIFKIVLPKSLNLYTNNEIWKGIKILFILRNMIVHGKEISSTISVQNEKLKVEYSSIFKKVLDYFKEQKVIQSNQIKSSSHKILSVKTTNHFIKTTVKFIDEILFKIYVVQKIDKWGEYHSFKSNIFMSYNLDYDKIYPPIKTKKTKEDDLPF